VSKQRYVVTGVEGDMADRVPVGTILVDAKRHEADGWTSWMFHTMGRGITSTITAYHVGPHRTDQALTAQQLVRRRKQADPDAVHAINVAILAIEAPA
jgi:hypothetical protein